MAERNPEGVFDDPVRLAESLIDVTLLPGQTVTHIGNIPDHDGLRRAVIDGCVIVQYRRTRLHRFQRIENRWQLLVLYFDKADRFLRSFARLSGHRRDFVADVAHLVPAKDGDIPNALAHIVIRLIFPGDDSTHALDVPGLRSIDADDARVRIRAAQNFSP